MPRIPRIPSPVIDRVPPPVVNTPRFEPPVVDGLVPPIVDIPSYEPPRYEPPTIDEKPVAPIPGLGGSDEEEEESEEENRELPDPEAACFARPNCRQTGNRSSGYRRSPTTNHKRSRSRRYDCCCSDRSDPYR